MSVLNARHVPGISCPHDWRPTSNEHIETCARCGATCERNSVGRIVAFDASGTLGLSVDTRRLAS